jgi:hypothetical protein
MSVVAVPHLRHGGLGPENHRDCNSPGPVSSLVLVAQHSVLSTQ